MTAKGSHVNTTAPLRNVALFMQLVERMQNRPSPTLNIGCFYGPSGYGKTWSAVYGANRSGAYYVECGASWNASTLVDAIYHELTGQALKGSIAAKVTEIIRILADDGRPLIIDEADHLIGKRKIDIIREVADKSGAPLVLIGEEKLSAKLMPFERAHNRVLDWVPAQPTNLADARHLVTLYARGLEIADDLLEYIIDQTDGCTRRVVANLASAREAAIVKGVSRLTLREWGADEVYTGMPSPRRLPSSARARSARRVA